MGRAVSDVVGFVLVFSLISLVIGAVYISGLGGLEDARDSERLINGERAFDVLAENVDDVVNTGAISRATEIKLSNARLHFGDPVTFNVTLTNTGTSYEASTVPIMFTIGDSHVVLTNGAVIRADTSGSAMLSGPSFVAGDHTLLPLIVTRTSGSGVGGSGRVLVRTVYSTSNVVRYNESAGPYDVRLNVTTDRPRAWQNYLEEQFGTDCSVTGDTVSCTTFRTERMDLQVVKLNVRIA